MKNYLAILVVALLTLILGFYVYNKKKSDNQAKMSCLELIPKKFTSYIIEIDNPSKNIGDLLNTSLIWNQIKKNKEFSNIEIFWKQTDSVFFGLKSNALSLTYFKKNKTKNSYFLMELEEKITDSISFGNWNTKTIGNYLIFSKSKDLSMFSFSNKLEKSIYKEEGFEEIYQLKGEGKNKVTLLQKTSEKWSIFDLTFLPEQFLANGFLFNDKPKNGIKSKLDLSFFSYVPSELKGMNIMHFEDVKELKKDSIYLSQIEKECNCDVNYNAYNWIETPAIKINLKNHATPILLFKINSVTEFKEGINKFVEDSLKLYGEDNKQIRKIIYSKVYTSLFGFKKRYTYFMRWNDYVIFAENRNNIEKYIFMKNSQFTLDNNKKLSEFLRQNINKKSQEITISQGINQWGISLDGGVGIVQTNVENETMKYKNLLFSKEVNLDGGKTNPKWELRFSSSLRNKIYEVNNHRTHDKIYLVQDENNTLYFITPNGEIKWKKNIGNPILGEIKNIDMFGNSKYQMVFNTKNKLFILDVLGRNVGEFPVPILDIATANVSVMDYDNNQNFRFLVPTTKGIKNIDKNGNLVSGWKQPTQKSNIETDINHFVISKLDYVIARDIENKFYFYNRKGEVRYKMNSVFGYPYILFKGSSISSTRIVYLDKQMNTISRQFLTNKPPAVLWKPSESINKLRYLDYNSDSKKEYVLVYDKKIEVYNMDFSLVKDYPLPSSAMNVQIWEGGYGFVDSQSNELTIYQDGKVKTIPDVNEYKVSRYKGKIRLIIGQLDKLRLLYL